MFLLTYYKQTSFMSFPFLYFKTPDMTYLLAEENCYTNNKITTIEKVYVRPHKCKCNIDFSHYAAISVMKY